MTLRTFPCLALGVLLIALVSTSRAAEAGLTVPLFKNLGQHQWKVATRYELAQRYFDQGLTLLYNFNHAEAIRSFEAVALLDAECAMAHWGIGYALGPNINAPMDQASAPKAWAAVQRALALQSTASPREQALIEALAARYAENPPADRAPLDLAYADAMRAAARRFAADDDVQTLFAESLMDTAPWNYWTAGKQLKPAAQEAVAAVERVLARQPEHPGANHLYIHLVEAGPNPHLGVPSAERLAKLAPAAGHLVHMPSHIFLRVGRYHDASEWNKDAIAADESYLRREKPAGTYPGGYYPHNVHFYWYSTMMEGRGRESLRAANKLAEYTLDLRCGAIEGPRQRYTPLLTVARFGRWTDVLTAAPPAVEYPFDRAMAHYARGVAFAAQGRAVDARVELQKFIGLQDSEPVKAMDNPYFPGTKILGIARAVLEGRVAGAQGDTTNQMAQLRRAVELEDALPYMEPPYWHHSTRLTLGAALLKSGNADDAEKIFRDDLEKNRDNGWGLFGLEQTLRQLGNGSAADKVRGEFRRVWRYAEVKPDLAWY